MAEELSYYVITSTCSALITGFLAWIAYRHRRQSAAAELAWLMVGLTGWSLSPVLVNLAQSADSAYLLARLFYVFPISVPVLWVRFTNRYTRGDRTLSPRSTWCLWIVPAVSLILLWTDPWYHLFWRSLSFWRSGSMLSWKVSFGPGFWLHALYSYALILFGLSRVIRYSIFSFAVYRWQNIAILTGSVFPIIASLPAVLGMTNLTFTPFGLAVTGAAFTWGVLRSRLLDLRPIARNLLIDRIHDGMIILDPQGKIVDLNRAALELIGVDEKQVVGAPGDQTLERLVSSGAFDKTQIEAVVGGRQSVFSVCTTPLTGPGQEAIGRLVHFHDITLLKKAETALRASEARSRAIIQALPDRVLIIDQDGNYVEDVHTTAESPVLQPQSPKPASIFDHFPPETAEAILEAVRATIQSQTGKALTYRVAVDGDELWYEARTAPLQAEPGQGSQVVWIDREITQQMLLYQEVEHLANTDELTGIANRRHFFTAAEEILALHVENQESCSLILIDIDHFKEVNDGYGHQIGDEVLQAVARRITHNLRSNDLIARYGGEEFIILLPGTGNGTARAIAERLRQAIASEPFTLRNVRTQISVSLGVVCLCPGQTYSIDQLVDKADAALYEAKHAGRNTVILNG